MAKEIENLIDNMRDAFTYYLDIEVYIPVKEELVGVEHSLGFRKELFKQYMSSELEKLKVEINKRIETVRLEAGQSKE